MTGWTTPHHPGRHRLGASGLRHCRDIAAVDERLRARSRAQRPARWLTRAGGAVLTAVVTVSAWYTAVGASAVAQMVTP